MTEDQLYNKIFARLPPPPADVAAPPGDDCAAIDFGPDRVLLLAVDQTIGGQHYYEEGPDAATPGQVARKLLGRNLSDIAAMGGTPRHALVAISQRGGADWLRAFYDGLLPMAKEYGVYLIGGDWAASSRENICSLTIVGEAPKNELVRRRGASPGNRLFATGAFGQSLPTGHHLHFNPRCGEARWLAAHNFAQAMIDVSDGLLLDCERLCNASGVSATINPDDVPRRTSATTREQALTDGEDYELLFAVAAEDVDRLTEDWPFPDVPLTDIGSFQPRSAAAVTDPGGKPFDVTATGYDHLA